MIEMGAGTKEPGTWYIPSPMATTGTGTPSPSVPMKLLLESRSRITVSPVPGLRSANLWEILPQVVGVARKPGSARLMVLSGMKAAILLM
jgi:hypothetical protein